MENSYKDIMSAINRSKEYENKHKDYIVYCNVTGMYTVMSRRKKERIEKEFWDSTTDGKIYPYSDGLILKLRLQWN